MKITVVAALALASASLFMAAPQARPLAFEVASIKPNASGDNRVMMQRAAGGRVNASGFSLKMLMRNAFRIQDFQIIGGPAWIASDRWDIQAKSEENATPAQVDEMLQTLLADRFGLKYHKETRELSTYALVVGKNGPKLEPAKADAPEAPTVVPFGRGQGLGERGQVAVGRGQVVVGGSGGQMQIAGGGMSMAQFAQLLGNNLGRTVIDKTGLTGLYDIKLTWTPEPGQGLMPPGAPVPGSGDRGASSPDGPLPSIFTAIQEQLGLKIDSTKGPIEVLVIDRVEKPTGNNQ